MSDYDEKVGKVEGVDEESNHADVLAMHWPFHQHSRFIQMIRIDEEDGPGVELMGTYVNIDELPVALQKVLMKEVRRLEARANQTDSGLH